jgi:2-amino-4-hydroxy-6-hydroxymethyldihydropteridine diphosphokinase
MTMTSSKRKKRSSTAPASSKRKSTDPPTRVYLGLGSNLGDRRLALERALMRLRGLDRLEVRRVSSVYRTDPVGGVPQSDFYNAVAEVSWGGGASELLEAIQRIEREVGRVPRERNGPREIDIDILDFGGMVSRRRSPPVLPHPRLAERRFVLAPLAEIAPLWRHPETGRTAREMMDSLAKRPGARRLRSPARRKKAARAQDQRRPR